MKILDQKIEKKTLAMESLFSLVEELMNEVSSEKQRKWACSQAGDNYKEKRSLTKKQAKEMCKSETEEELEETSMASGAVSGAASVGGNNSFKSDNETLIREDDLIEEILNAIISGGRIEYVRK